MAGRGADPFQFDEIYKQAGVDNLFVKKSMADMKKAPAAPKTNGHAVPSPAPAKVTPDYAIGTSASFKSSSVVSPRTVPLSQGASKMPVSSSTSDDPFADLGVGRRSNQPMSAQRTPRAETGANSSKLERNSSSSADNVASAAAAAPIAHVGTYDLDNIFGVGSKPAAAAAGNRGAAVSANSHADDPFAAFVAVGGATPIVHSPPTTSAAAPAATEFDDLFFAPAPAAAAAPPAQPQPQPRKQPSAAPVAASQQQRLRPRPAVDTTPPGSPPLNSQHIPVSTNSLEPAMSTSPSAAAAAAAAATQPAPATTFFAKYEAPQSARPSSPPPPPSYDDVSRAEREYDDPPAYQFGTAPAHSSGQKKGFAGLLKKLEKGSMALGKKAMKAAQTGLHQLEGALQNMDGSNSAGGQRSSNAGSGDGGRGRHRGSGRSGASRWDDLDDGRRGGDGRDGVDGDGQIPADEVLAFAIQISELPRRQQEEEMYRLSPRLRGRVREILREQAALSAQGDLSPSHRATTAAAGATATTAGDAYRPRPQSGSPVDVTTSEFRFDDDEDEGQAVASMPPPPAYAAATAGAVKQQDQQQLPRVASPVSAAPAVASPRPAIAATSVPVAAHTTAQAAAVRSPTAAAANSTSDDLVSVGSPRASAAHEEVDLLGFSTPAAAAAAAAAAPAAQQAKSVPQVVDVHDADDFFSGGQVASPAVAASTANHLDDFLSGGSSNARSSSRPATQPPQQQAQRRPAAVAGAGAPSSSLMDLHALAAVNISGHEGLYDEEQGEAGEPELRKRLREQRLAAKHAKMKAALAEKQRAEEEEQQRRVQQQQHKEAYKETILTWKNKHKGNIRGMLSSFQTVLWPDHGWKPVGMGDLLEPAQVRKVWMKANLLVHPDKVRQRNGTDEQVAIADMVFDVLKEGWSQFNG